nr:unnamed protein product [Callosobruchus analis]
MWLYPSGNLNVEKPTFNKRLSRAKVTIDCAFTILSNKWRVSMKSIEIYTKHAKFIIKVASLLHNIVREVDARSRSNNRASSRAPSIQELLYMK